MKMLRLQGFIPIFVVSLFLIALLISVLIDKLKWIRYSCRKKQNLKKKTKFKEKKIKSQARQT